MRISDWSSDVCSSDLRRVRPPRSESCSTMDQTAFRPAVRADAPVLTELVKHAGEGIPLYLWDKLREPGETAWDVGRRRAARDEGAFSYRKAVMIEHNGQAAGCLIGYAVDEAHAPIPDEIPEMYP